MVVMAPGDELDVPKMLDFALEHPGPVSIRYPKASAESIERSPLPIELGRAEIIEWGTDGTIIACGTLLAEALRASAMLREKDGLDVGVVNARFVKPIDADIVRRAIYETGFVIAIEESTLCGGFGSAVLEAACRAGLNTENVACLGIPDHFVEHGDRSELLADVGLDASGIAAAAIQLAGRIGVPRD